MIGNLDRASCPPRTSTGVFRRRRVRLLVGLLGIGLSAGCGDVVVQPADVAAVRVEPSEAELAVGSNVQLSAQALDGDDRPVSGVAITWSSLNPGIATVSSDGLVTGQGPGQVQVRATVGGHTGSAALVVLRPAVIVLGRTAIGFSEPVGAPAPQAVDVAITNGGDVPLTGLSAAIDFGEGPTGWLEVSLAATTAPTTLSVTASPAGLDPGGYAAVVLVTHGSASTSPTELPVTLEVREGAPNAPTDPSAHMVSPSLVRVTWTDNGNSEDGFEIQRREGAGTFAGIGTVGAGETRFDDDTVVPDRAYGYRVRACGAGGCSAFSVVASVTMPPLGPASLTAVTISTTSIRVSWSDASLTATRFEVDRRLDGGDFTRIATPGGGSTTYTDGGLSPNTSYTYRVRACNDGGCSPFSDEATATTPPLPVPAPPSGLSATATEDAAEVTLSWVDNSDDETGFRIERRAPGQTDFALLTTVDPDVVEHSDGTVEPDGTYVYRVAACAAGGCSAFTDERAATTYPLAPSGLQATAQSSSRIDLSWTDNSATETGFRIERRTSSGSFAQVATVGVDNTSYSDGGLDPATSYTYRARACNSGGCSGYTGEASATTTVTPAPDAPSNLSATTVSATRIDLAWTDNSSDETAFRVERLVDDGSFELRTTLPANTTTFTDEQVAADHVYVYRVEACAGADLCSDHSNEASATTPPVPPTGLTATALSTSSIEIGWDDNVRTATSFELERRPPGGEYAPITTLPAGSTGHVDTDGLSAETEYTYRVRSCNAEGCSAFTSGATATTHLPAPSGLGATPVSATAIDLSWTDNSITETGFRIERRQGGAGPFTAVANLGADITSYSDTGLTPGTLYQYHVRACRAENDCSDTSNRADAATHAAPVAPSALSANATSTSSVTLTWTDNSTTEQVFQVQRAVAAGDWADLIELGPDTESHVDGGLSAETSYGYRVRACSGGACSSYSNADTAVTHMPPPTSLIATTTSSTEIDLTWTDNSATETGFEINRDGSLLTTVAANTTSYSVDGLEPATEYVFQVRAVNEHGPSAWSNPETATTHATPPPAAPSGPVTTPPE